MFKGLGWKQVWKSLSKLASKPIPISNYDITMKNRSKSQGFTLIEVLVASAILVLLAAGFLGLQYIMSQNQVSAWNNYLAIEQANTAVSQLEKELRNAQQSEAGAYPLETPNDQEIVFFSDVDYDGESEKVRYTLNGTTLEKGVIDPVGEPATYPLANERVKTITDIVQNGADPVFYYYNKDWPTDIINNPLPASDRISDTTQVKIILVTNPKPANTEFDYTLETDVKIRMLN
jgi:prepilin-type N-terminal cleavage/methylation domain-containing protein